MHSKPFGNEITLIFYSIQSFYKSKKPQIENQRKIILVLNEKMLKVKFMNT